MSIKNPSNTAKPPMAGKAYFTEQEVAARLGVSVKWLQKMRLRGGGIAYAKFGSAVRYPIERVLAFEAEQLRTSTSDSGKITVELEA